MMDNLKEKNCMLIKTLNKMGFMTEWIDPYTADFIDFSIKAPGPCLEIGAAYGIATLKVLDKGAFIVANDLSADHLKILSEKASCNKNLVLIPGKFPKNLNFCEQSLGAVLSSRVFHFFPGKLIDSGLKLIFKWLRPNGKLFFISETPYLNDYKNFIPVFEKRKSRKVRWPGVIKDVSVYSSRAAQIPSFLNLLDPDILNAALQRAGFSVEKIGTIARPDYPADLTLDGRESVGAIAIKL
jgi:hypothetical protein